MSIFIDDDSAYVELTIDEGSNFGCIVECFDLLDQAIDLTGATARMQFRRTSQSSTVLLEANIGNSKLSLGTTDGNIIIALTPADTNALGGNCVYDCKATFPNGEIVTAFHGAIALNPAVTR